MINAVMPDQYYNLHWQDVRKEIFKQLLTLPPRQERVIKMRYGLTDEGEKTLLEVGKTLGMHRERVRQMQMEALARLRHSKRSEKLRELYYD